MSHNSIPNLIDEIDAMVQFASGVGKVVPPDVVAHLYSIQQKVTVDAQIIDYSSQELMNLSIHHATMAQLVFPAQPKSITIMQQEAANPG
jgi:hypothetical protein